jgi:amino acid permease
MKYHGIDRNKIPYKSPFQPYLTYFGLLMVILVIFFSGFEVFLKDNWSVSRARFYYARVATKVDHSFSKLESSTLTPLTTGQPPTL